MRFSPMVWQRYCSLDLGRMSLAACGVNVFRRRKASMVYDIVLYPDSRLLTPCDRVDEFDTPALHQLVTDMFETMYYHDGVGLAAPQIGVMKQVAVIDVTVGQDPQQKIVIINPRLTTAEGMQQDYEGCLCLTGFHEQVTRAMKVVVEAREPMGAAVRLQGEGLLARAFQHEIDHLNGVLFIQHLSALKRDLIRRKIGRMRKAGEWGAVASPLKSEVPAHWSWKWGDP